ncbi:C4-dicarboxylate transporter DcuC [Escherichia coli]|nr:C4-dicarboxylate transporter DcuC [Escherichia coli]SQY93989.1 C4-dicarboxylate transporter DcuC [Escherichia coli]
MLTFIELLIGVVVIVGVARYIIKGYSATGVLFVGGLLLLIISAIMGHKVLPSSQASTGYSATDIVEYVKILLMSRGGDLGMMIMMLCGFAAYMTHIGANDMVVGNDSNLLIVFYVQIMPDDFVMQLHRF